MGCSSCNKISNTCGEKIFAACTFFEGVVPTFSTLAQSECYTLEEIVADIYTLIEGVKSEIDLTNLLTNGITYTLDQGVLFTKNALKRHAELILEMQQQISDLLTGFDGDLDISTWGLTFKCLVDPCGDDITQLKQLIQIMIDKLCDLESRVTVLETP